MEESGHVVTMNVRIGSVLPLIVLACGLVLIHTIQTERRASELAEVDTALLDHERLAERRTQAGLQRAREVIGAAAGRERHDHSYRLGRIGLRPCCARHARQRGSARGQMQKLSAGKFHCRRSPFGLLVCRERSIVRGDRC